MRDEDFLRVRADATAARWAVCDAKSVEYTRGNLDDRLCNFSRIAETLGLSWTEVWYVYFAKHVDAIIEWIKTGKEGTEGIEGRIEDAQNYLDLLGAKVFEMKAGSRPTMRVVN